MLRLNETEYLVQAHYAQFQTSRCVAKCRGKAPTLPLPSLEDLDVSKAASLKAISLTPPEKDGKEQHIWGMRSSLVLASLATTMMVGIIMLIGIALLQPE